MSNTQTFFAGYLHSSEVLGHTESMAQVGSQGIFQTNEIARLPHILQQMERRDRSILLLLDGKRTLKDVARLTQRNELEIAYVLIRLLKRGYIEFIGAPALT